MITANIYKSQKHMHVNYRTESRLGMIKNTNGYYYHYAKHGSRERLGNQKRESFVSIESWFNSRISSQRKEKHSKSGQALQVSKIS